MYQPIQIKTTTRNSTSHWALCGLRLIPLVLACFGLSPALQAVNPPPDGGYAGFNTAEGTSALFNLTSGVQNTALGYQALFHNTTGNLNTGVGYRSLFFNSTGVQNTATGINALSVNTTGSRNTAFGVNSLAHSTTGSSSTAVGVQALFSNTTGEDDNAFGSLALFSNTTGTANNAFGFRALQNNTTGNFNNAHGDSALGNNTTKLGNTAFGDFALRNNVTGNNNTAFGNAAGLNVTGSGNTFIGDQAGINETDVSNVICIQSPGDGTAFTSSNRCFIGKIRGVSPGNGDGIAVFVDSDGQLGTAVSSRRFKKDIKPMDQTSEAILALKPVTFHYKDRDTKKAANTPQFGLIAEDVAEVDPDLVIRNADGELMTVRYDAVNAMLLNEFLKEHKKVEEQQTNIAQLQSKMAKQAAIIAQQQKGMEVLAAQLKEQATQIQKVSVQLDVSQPAPKMVANH